MLGSSLVYNAREDPRPSAWGLFVCHAGNRRFLAVKQSKGAVCTPQTRAYLPIRGTLIYSHGHADLPSRVFKVAKEPSQIFPGFRPTKASLCS